MGSERHDGGSMRALSSLACNSNDWIDLFVAVQKIIDALIAASDIVFKTTFHVIGLPFAFIRAW